VVVVSPLVEVSSLVATPVASSLLEGTLASSLAVAVSSPAVATLSLVAVSVAVLGEEMLVFVA